MGTETNETATADQIPGKSDLQTRTQKSLSRVSLMFCTFVTLFWKHHAIFLFEEKKIYTDDTVKGLNITEAFFMVNE